MGGRSSRAATEATSYPREIAEAALAHQVGNAVEQAYRRGTAFEKRRELMASWSRFATSATSKTSEPADPHMARMWVFIANMTTDTAAWLSVMACNLDHGAGKRPRSRSSLIPPPGGNGQRRKRRR